MIANYCDNVALQRENIPDADVTNAPPGLPPLHPRIPPMPSPLLRLPCRLIRLVALCSLPMLAACEDMGLDEQNAACQSQLSTTPVMFAIGSDGLSELCECTVDSLAVRFPDAGARWVAYQAELDARVQSRGLLGFVLDTAWANTRGKEIGEFAAAQAEIIGVCTAQLLPPL